MRDMATIISRFRLSPRQVPLTSSTMLSNEESVHVKARASRRNALKRRHLGVFYLHNNDVLLLESHLGANRLVVLADGVFLHQRNQVSLFAFL